jgi:hypothetical protein
MNDISEMQRKIDYLEDTLACLRGENAALKAELAQLSHNKQSTPCVQCGVLVSLNTIHCHDCLNL